MVSFEHSLAPQSDEATVSRLFRQYPEISWQEIGEMQWQAEPGTVIPEAVAGILTKKWIMEGSAHKFPLLSEDRQAQLRDLTDEVLTYGGAPNEPEEQEGDAFETLQVIKNIAKLLDVGAQIREKANIWPIDAAVDPDKLLYLGLWSARGLSPSYENGRLQSPGRCFILDTLMQRINYANIRQGAADPAMLTYSRSAAEASRAAFVLDIYDSSGLEGSDITNYTSTLQDDAYDAAVVDFTRWTTASETMNYYTPRQFVHHDRIIEWRYPDEAGRAAAKGYFDYANGPSPMMYRR